MKYVKKPVIVDAIQYDGKNFDEIAQNFNVANFKRDLGDYLLIPTLEGEMRANPGDFIVRGVKGEFYPVKPDIFEECYDEANSSDEVLYSDEGRAAKVEAKMNLAIHPETLKRHIAASEADKDNGRDFSELPPVKLESKEEYLEEASKEVEDDNDRFIFPENPEEITNEE